LCFAAAFSFFALVRIRLSVPENCAKYARKTRKDIKKKKPKKRKLHKLSFILLFYYIAQDKHGKATATTARELRFEDLERDFSLRAQFSLVCAFYSPFLLA